jgi:1-acyl-sn-glycerol-3-phosphate acyltransferase
VTTETGLDQSSRSRASGAKGGATIRHRLLELLKERRFGPFFFTQFLGAANDSVFKFAFTLLVTYRGPAYTSVSTATAINLIAAVFVLPFLLFSATSGQLSDRFDKGRLMRIVKWLELGIMLLGAWGFAEKSFPTLLVCTLLMGTHSTVFGPAKYAYLPQHLGSSEIVAGNGLVEMGTFVAILLGTLLGGALIDSGEHGHLYSAATCVALACAGVLTSQGIPSTPPPDPGLKIDWNPLRVTWRNLRIARESRAVFLSLLGISWLWFYGALLLTHFAPFAKEALGGDPGVANLLAGAFTLGIAVGSLACDRLSRGMVEIGLVPFGSIGMTLFGVDLYFASEGLPLAQMQTVAQFLAHARHWRIVIDLFLLSACAGLYSVPLYALIQTRCAPTHRARVIAANNIINALFMIVASVYAIVLLDVAKLSVSQLLLSAALLNAAVAVHIYGLMPEFLLRFLSWLLVHSIYRIQTNGTSHIPERGAALIVCNHVSYVDALLLMAISPRPIRFVMDVTIFRTPVMSWLFRQVRAIPIASAKVDAAVMARAFEQVSEALRDGQLVCIFPEGRITDTGELYPFRPGLTRVLERDPVPVVPVALRGLWGSAFSRAPGLPRPIRALFRIFSRLSIEVGAALDPAVATPDVLQQQVAALRGNWR